MVLRRLRRVGALSVTGGSTRPNRLRSRHDTTVEEYRKLLEKEAKRQLEQAARQAKQVSFADGGGSNVRVSYA